MRELYNILIVDDEELAIRGIEKGVNWDKLPIDKVFKAHSVETAKRIMGNYQISILLTDIDLVNDTGINLLRWIREEQKNVECIFFTCHAEFEYAQEALRLGARDFLLKPIPYDKLEILIANTVNDLSMKKQQKEKYSIMDEMVKDSNQDKESQIVNEIKEYIMRNLARDIRREELANIVHYSVSYISKVFKERENVSVADYIFNQRLVMAKHLLRVTELSITEIADRTGFGYHSYFTKRFKEATGETPQQYRMKIREDDIGLDDL